MTDTQPRWTLRRNAVAPHRHMLSTSTNDFLLLTDAEADDVERALPALNGIEPPRRFTAEVHTTDSIGASAIVDGPGIDHRMAGLLCFTTAEERDAFVEQVNAPRYPSPPAEDLPPGVKRYDADTLVARGIDIPEGWMFYGPDVDRDDDESVPWWNWRDRETEPRLGHVIYEVRRIQTPAVVQVPLHKLAGRVMPDMGSEDAVTDWDANWQSRQVTTYWPGGHGTYPLHADGMVEVLAENGPQQ